MPPRRRPAHVLTALCSSLTAIGVLALTAPAPAAAEGELTLTLLDRYEGSATFDDGGAEIPAFDPKTGRLFVTNAAESAVDVLELDGEELVLVAQIEVPDVTSVAVSSKGVLAVAVPADPKTDPGEVRQYNTKTLKLRRTSQVGALPDMLTFTADGKQIVVANEGEPSGYCAGDVDPEGSVSIIHAPSGKVRTADFSAFNDQADALRAQGVRIFGPGATVAQDVEPEYIALSADGRTAYVALQENNALATVDVDTATVTDVVPLGLKDHSTEGNGLDASDRDGEINIQSWPVLGMFMPDGIDAYTAADGREYVVTANEGDAREYDCFEEEERVKNLELSQTAFPNAAELQQDENLGRLTVTTTSPRDAEGRYTELQSFGARSFSIRDASGALIFDSGDAFEQITAARIPEFFNSTNDENETFDNRSDNKGPEPEGIEIGRVGDRTYAFVGLERVGGIVIYDITDPADATFVDYVNPRDFGGDAEAGTAGDLGPEGLVFISAADSPTGQPLLAVANEISGTTSLYSIG